MTREENEATVIEVSTEPPADGTYRPTDLCTDHGNAQEIDNEEESSISSDDDAGDAEETGAPG